MKSLVAFYENSSSAQQAKDELELAGFDNVRMYDSRESDDPGLWESIKQAFGFASEDDQRLYAEASRRGACAVSLSIDGDDPSDDPMISRAISIMQEYGPITLQGQGAGQAAIRDSDDATTAATSTTTTQPGVSRAPAEYPKAARQEDQQEHVIPVAEEQLEVGKRRIEQGGVRIHSHVTERPVEETVNLQSERVNVERQPVDRPVEAGDDAFRERVIEASETVEKPVVNKQARVVEEVRLNKQVEQTSETVRDTVRRTDVEVEQLGESSGRTREHAGASAAEDWTSEFIGSFAGDQRYRGRDWSAIEPEARSSFERQYPSSKWDQVKDDIRRAYDRMRSKA